MVMAALRRRELVLVVPGQVKLRDRVPVAVNQPVQEQAQTMNDVCGDATGAEVKNFVTILSTNKRLSLLPEIYAQFELLKSNLEKSVDVEVVSAFDLDDATAGKLADVLGKKLERDVKVSTSTDSDLLGGVLIRAGDLVIDGSVRGRLNKLAEAMNS